MAEIKYGHREGLGKGKEYPVSNKQSMNRFKYPGIFRQISNKQLFELVIKQVVARGDPGAQAVVQERI